MDDSVVNAREGEVGEFGSWQFELEDGRQYWECLLPNAGPGAPPPLLSTLAPRLCVPSGGCPAARRAGSGGGQAGGVTGRGAECRAQVGGRGGLQPSFAGIVGHYNQSVMEMKFAVRPGIHTRVFAILPRPPPPPPLARSRAVAEADGEG
eukprot:2377899-Rhodomonas_salina.1